VSVHYKDYYNILGVARNSSESAIKKGYRKLARQFHPDINSDPQAKQRFQEINEAWEVLSDPEKRARYDQLGAHWNQNETFTPPPGWDPFSFGFNDPQSQSGFSDFFDLLFGQSRPRGADRNPFSYSAASATGQDIAVSLSIPLSEAYNGARRRIKLPAAHGATAKTVEIRIPPRTRDGTILKLNGLGTPGNHGAAHGDLLLTLSIQEDPRFSLNDSDLNTIVEISPEQAVLGGELEIKTPDGIARIKIPPQTKAGKRFKLKEKGLKKRDGTLGDLYAEICIQLPDRLSEEALELYRQLHQLER
jgi:curved DNA-binding protein